MQIDRFNAWLQTATPDGLERAERALEAGVRRVGGRYREARLDAGRWHWMHREVFKKRGTRDYVAWLDSNQWPRTTVYEQIADWLASQEYYTLPVETLPDEVNPREQASKQAIEEARNARLGRGRAPKPELEGHVRIPWPVLFAMRDEIDLFREAWRTNEAKVAEILLDAFQTVILLDQFHYEENIDVDFSMHF
jgi:hypothetical protein